MSRKTIAVIGATGAQGGGLIRAILADPQGGFAARAVTRDVNSDKAKRTRRDGRGGGRRRRRRRAKPRPGVRRRVRRLLRDVLLGALQAGAGVRGSAQHGAAPPRRPACRTSSGPRSRTRAPSSRPTRCRRSWTNTRCRTSMPRARPTSSSAMSGVPTTYPLCVVLLGQPHLLRRRPGEGSGRQPVFHAADREREDGGHRVRGHRKRGVRHLQGGVEVLRPEGGRGRRAPRLAPRWQPGSRTRSARTSATTP